MKKFLLLFLCAVMISSIVFTGIGINSSVMANSLEEETDTPVVLPPTPPVAPSEVNATTVSSSEIRVVWTSSSDDTTEFIIERKQEEGSYSQITTVSSSTTQYNDSGLTPNTRYYYKIKAANKVAVSGYSSEATAITSPAPVTPPFKPTGLTATANSTSEVGLTWAKASGTVDRYEIERKTSGGNYQLLNTISNGNATSYNDTGASPSTTYYYRIIAFNSGGASPYSDEVNATTQGVIVNPPAKPTNLTTVGIFSDKINLSWVDNADSEAGYKVERKTANGKFMEIIVLGPNSTTYSDTGISPNTVYTYRVRTYNTGGNSDYSNEVSTKTGGVPEKPMNVKITNVSTDRISISWQDNASNENGFRIERKVDNGNWSELTTVKANATSYTDTGLSNNRTYSYRVRAYNDAGNSGYSNEVSTKTGGVPEKPTNVKIINVSTDRISISWQDNASNENGFRIERKVDNDSWREFDIVGTNITNYTDTDLSKNRSYSYRIRAYNDIGNSEYSNEVSSKTINKNKRKKATTRLYIGRTLYYVNDQVKEMDTAAIIMEGRTLLPIKYIAEPMGASVDWNSKEGKITIELEDNYIEIWLDKNVARVNGERKPIDDNNINVRPVIIPPGRTMLPLKFIAENLGCQVEWNSKIQEVRVISSEE